MNLRVSRELDWQKSAACRTSVAHRERAEVFFPPGRPKSSAKDLCMSCDVRGECLSYALGLNLVGIWGGTTEGERRGMLSEYAG